MVFGTGVRLINLYIKSSVFLFYDMQKLAVHSRQQSGFEEPWISLWVKLFGTGKNKRDDEK